ncbi:hypothetical protein [Cytobacillus oceanisediminis]|uniref:hypothetical protein n=1 Tax=Cytobacillus oceanisediminis TaxID=665099 RepID=UPI002079ECD3|nr:hypothetical protein [Cytobacillus oceanisediminis]USK44669.1 hypothetical protein LIT27_01870 [Cytobacillus oceanisediminis]
MKKSKFLTIMASLVFIFTFSTTSFAAFESSVEGPISALSTETPYIYLDKGNTLHIYVRNNTSSKNSIGFKVVDNLGQTVSSGTVAPGKYVAYPKGAPEGYYKLVYTVSGNDTGYGRLNDSP